MAGYLHPSEILSGPEDPPDQGILHLIPPGHGWTDAALGSSPSETTAGNGYTGDTYTTRETAQDMGAASVFASGPAPQVPGPRVPNLAMLDPLTGAGPIPTPAEVFLDRIWILLAGAPVTQIILGNLITSFSATVQVWNAYRVAKTLGVLDFDPADGAQIAGPEPRTLAGFEVEDYALTIPIDGPPAVDSLIVFDFLDAEDPELLVQATIAVAFLFPPDWSATVDEVLEWKTDVMRSWNLEEQRARLRKFPRRSLAFQVLLDRWAAPIYTARVYGQQARAWVVPVWSDATFLAADLAAAVTVVPVSTAGRDFQAGGLALLAVRDLGQEAADAGGVTSEVVEILSVNPGNLVLVNPTTNPFPAGSFIVPARTGRLLENVTIERPTFAYLVSRPEFQFEDLAPELAPLTGLEVYKGEDVLPAAFEHDWNAALADTFSRAWDLLDNQTGTQRIDARRRAPNILQRKRWLLASREEIGERKRWLAMRAGRHVAFWAPLESEDLRLAAAPAGATVSIKTIGYLQFYGADDDRRRDLILEEKDGTRHFMEVTAVTPGPSGQEILTVTPALPPIALDDVRHLRFLGRFRLESDSAEIEYETSEVAIMRPVFRLL